MHNNVFISYASEDITQAEKLYDYLLSKGYEPWLDKKKLLPGQIWDNEIRFALKKANFVILLLSNTSVEKRGYVQKEFKLALEYCEEKLDTDIYIIPIKLDDCEIPEKIKKYQWTELKNPNSFEIILQSLDLQKDKYLKKENQKIKTKDSFEIKEIIIKKDFGKKPKNSVEVKYPKFFNTTDEDLLILNTYIENSVFQDYSGFRFPFGMELFTNLEDCKEYDYPNNNLSINYKMELVAKHIISYSILFYRYTGGAHGNYATIGYNFTLNPLREFNLKMLLDDKPDTLVTLQKYCKERIIEKIEKKLGKTGLGGEFLYNKEPLKLEWKTFDNFYIHKNSIFIIFNPYQETAYAFGQHEIEIKFSELLAEHPNLNTLKRLQEMNEHIT